MNYTYFSAAPQPYHFMGTRTGIDPKTIRSIPLEAAFLPSTYDTFRFQHGVSTTQCTSKTSVAWAAMPIGSVDSGGGGELEDSQTSGACSSNGKKDSRLIPAQSRRKAQNRAAQRAFRERKERHVRDLEAKLSALESSTHSLQSENKYLKLALQRTRTENEILCATSGQYSSISSRPVSISCASPGPHVPDDKGSKIDKTYNVHALPIGIVFNSTNKNHDASHQNCKGKEIPATKVWDFIQLHPLVQQDLVDIAGVYNRLRGAAKCDSHCLVFEESTIWRAVEKSCRSGKDVLI